MVFAAIEAQTGGFFDELPCPVLRGLSNDTDVPPTFYGILGLAFDSLLVSPTQSFLTKLEDVSVHDTAGDAFAMQLCNNDQGSLWLPTNLTIRWGHAVQWAPIIDESFYIVQWTRLVVVPQNVSQSHTVVFAGPPSGELVAAALIDSGTNRLVFPDPIFQTLIETLNADPNIVQIFGTDLIGTGQCMSVGEEPNATAELNAILPRLLIRMGIDGAVEIELDAVSSYLIEWQYPPGTYWYCDGLETSGNDLPYSILGWALFSQSLVVFDRKQNRMGFSSIMCDNNHTDVKSAVWGISPWGTCTSPHACGSTMQESVHGTQCRSVSCLTFLDGLEHDNETDCLVNTGVDKPTACQACSVSCRIAGSSSTGDRLRPMGWSLFAMLSMSVYVWCIHPFC
jgi:hypothetical protein